MWRDAPSPDLLQSMIEEGSAAAAVLSTPAFKRVVDDLTNLHIARMLAAPVGESGRDERERNHVLQTAFTEIVQELLARRASGEQAERVLEEQQLHDD